LELRATDGKVLAPAGFAHFADMERQRHSLPRDGSNCHKAARGPADAEKEDACGGAVRLARKYQRQGRPIMKSHRLALAACAWTAATLGIGMLAADPARAQSYGIEFHNTLMPVSGAMGGASIARPQDCLSAINGNPAALSNFEGTQFSFGGAWAEPTYNITQLDPLPLIGVDPFSAKSGTPGGAVGNIGVTQSLSAMGMPATFGLGFITSAAAGSEFRGVPESNGTSSQYVCFDIVSGLGVSLTDRLSAGAAFTLGSAFLDGPFTDLGGMTGAYGIRGTIGMQYALSDVSWVGTYWQTKKHFHFDDAAVINGQAFDVSFDQPENLGLGWANQGLMDGRLLLAMDVIFKQYSNADFLQSLYDNQWVYQLGAQYTVSSKFKIRAGYSYNTNPMRGPSTTEIGGVPIPDGIPGLRYIQGQFAAIGQHFLTGGVGVSNVMPGVDLDLLAGGMFEDYWVGTYLTWRFGGANNGE
jgi:long-chain fatty acid transport protein